MRCRMHGGAKGSGAPKGNHNALKHGTYTKEALQRRAAMRHLLRDARKLLDSSPKLAPGCELKVAFCSAIVAHSPGRD